MTADMAPAFGPKVFGIGLSKTGTTSLYAALMRLGIRTLTYRHLEATGLDDWREGRFATDYLAGAEAATDIPIPTYFRELDELYPGSKFILTERPLVPWLESLGSQFMNRTKEVAGFRRDMRFATYGIAGFNAMRFARIAAEHSESVRAHFAKRPQDLLVLNLFDDQGWPELCDFLGHPIPRSPFPNVKPGFRATLRSPDPGAPLLPFQARM
jgi:hypothetical protein